MSRLFKLFRQPRRNQRGHALTVMLIMLAISLALLASMLDLTFNETTNSGRNTQYNAAAAAAEAATEKVLAQMQYDFSCQSVNTDLTAYSALVPDQTGWPVQYSFKNLTGTANQTDVVSLGATVVTNLNSDYSGLYGLVTPFAVSSRATPVGGQMSAQTLSATISETVWLTSIPVFQFAIFYNLELEINPGADMQVNGKVHSNGEIYAGPNPGVNLEFQADVSAVDSIINTRDPNDGHSGGVAAPTYDGLKKSPANSLNMPIGTNNNPTAVHEILEPPDPGESSSALISKLRLYNQADLIISNSDNGITVMGGAWNNFTVLTKDLTNFPTPCVPYYRYSWVTNAVFYDWREGKKVIATEIDVGRFNLWRTNATKKTNGGYALASTFNELGKTAHVHGLNSIYVVDSRNSGASNALKAVRVTNGKLLPSDGLTVVSVWPMYIKGHYNLNNGTDTTYAHTTTTGTKPAALIGDAITILSSTWPTPDPASTVALTDAARSNAGDTTVNCALLAGIVPTSGGDYSGGVENYPRFLENWSGNHLTYNGSMVVMFPSYYATGLWGQGNVYNPPNRDWAFDTNFRTQSKLPPLTPQVKTLIRQKFGSLANTATAP